MSRFIELTLQSGTKTLVNIDKIHNIFYSKDKNKTRISFVTDYIHVNESYETVKDLINKS